MLLSCNLNTRISNQNLYYTYKKEADRLTADFLVHHFTADSSNLYFKISSTQLKFNESNKISTAKLKISCRIYPSYESKEIIDTFNVTIIDTATKAAHSILGVIPFKLKTPSNLVLEVSATDINSQRNFTMFIPLDKSDNNSRQHFLVFKKGNRFPSFESTFNASDTLSIFKSNSSVLFVKYYNREFPLPAPPFSDVDYNRFTYKADSSFSINQTGNSFLIVPTHKGFYHLQSDSSQKNGLTIFRFYDGFPELISADQLTPPLRFITSKKEFEAIASSADKKQAVDDFWLKNADNTTRARKVLKTFYNRVQDANKYFTSYVEGWKSDRGLIYIIYGPPNSVFKNNDSETWIYGESGSVRSITFVFSRVNNPFTFNDYSLNRSEAYKNSWYMAVDIWRQGRIYAE
jgi:GWxTD domain-containing protein